MFFAGVVKKIAPPGARRLIWTGSEILPCAETLTKKMGWCI